MQIVASDDVRYVMAMYEAQRRVGERGRASQMNLQNDQMSYTIAINPIRWRCLMLF